MINNLYYEKDYVLARQRAESTERAAKSRQAANEVQESKRVLCNEIDRNSK